MNLRKHTYPQLTKRHSTICGFTFVELPIVIVLVGILSALLLPRYWEVARQARIATLEGVVGAMRSAINITRTKGFSQGLSVAASNPGGGSAQSVFIVDVEGLSVEVDWRNLCPESRPELGDAISDPTLSMLDYILLEDNTAGASGELLTRYNNQYTWVGYTILASGFGAGCYVRYDSFGDPLCTVDLVMDDC